jgi:ABC-2 type transport system permease protein
MNSAMVRQLILKDWYLNRWMILGSIGAGLLSLGIIVTGSKVAFMLGIIMLVMVVVGVGAQLAVTTILYERKEQTLAFVMSLPISWSAYTTAKILANLILFLIPWVALAAATVALILSAPGIPHGFLPFVVIMAVEVLASTCLIVAAALISESQGWTTAAIAMGTLGINGVGYYAAHVRGMAAGLWGNVIAWSPAATMLLLAEFATIGAILGLTFLVQSRKTDFL